MFIWNVSRKKEIITPDETDNNGSEEDKLSDQEVLESSEAIYFTENFYVPEYELKVGQI